MMFSLAQQADIEAAHIEISRVLGTLYRPGISFADIHLDPYCEQINRDYSAATLRGLLERLMAQLAQLHSQMAGYVECTETSPESAADRFAALEQKVYALIQLMRSFADCLDEIGFVRMCLDCRARKSWFY